MSAHSARLKKVHRNRDQFVRWKGRHPVWKRGAGLLRCRGQSSAIWRTSYPSDASSARKPISVAWSIIRRSRVPRKVPDQSSGACREPTGSCAPWSRGQTLREHPPAAMRGQASDTGKTRPAARRSAWAHQLAKRQYGPRDGQFFPIRQACPTVDSGRPRAPRASKDIGASQLRP